MARNTGKSRPPSALAVQLPTAVPDAEAATLRDGRPGDSTRAPGAGIGHVVARPADQGQTVLPITDHRVGLLLGNIDLFRSADGHARNGCLPEFSDCLEVSEHHAIGPVEEWE
jgi:hypothetical protein